MANVFIEESTLTAIGDAIRAKTGTADKIFPADMATAIEGITGGGEGVPDRYVTVTFHYTDDDFQPQEFTRLVLVGDDCPDPYVQNRIETPTKESTAQYDYTFNGWATADGGTADSAALQNITEDKVLYAVFAESVRQYTITYYNEDGTVLDTKPWYYGAYPSYTPEHPTDPSHYTFDGWTPSLVTVTGNASYTAAWREKKALRDYTWAELDAMSIEECRANFSVGEAGPNGAVLLAFEHDDLADGTGKAKMTFGCNYKIDKSLNYARWGDNADWSTCLYRTNAISWVEASPTTNFAKDYAKLVKKQYIATDGVIKTCDDKYFAPSLSELGYTDVPAEGERYPAFNEVGLSSPVSKVGDFYSSSIYYSTAQHVRTLDSNKYPYFVSDSSAPQAVAPAAYKRAPYITFCI